jgi:O-antigen/teichoic acid export membrane protein
MLRSVAVHTVALWRRPFARNWSLLVLASFGSQAMSMIATLRIARVLAPQGYGEFNLVITMASLASVAAGLGLRNVLIRESAREPERVPHLLVTSAVLRGLAMVCATGGLLAYLSIGGSGVTLDLGTIVVGLLIAQATWDLVECVAYGHQRMEFSAALNIAASTMWMIAAWTAPVDFLTPFNLALVFAVVQGAKALAYWAAARRLWRLHPGGKPVADIVSISRYLLARSLPFYWMSLLTAATSQLPVLFLADRSGASHVGLYNAGLRLTYPLQVLMENALTSLYPGLARTATSDPQRFVRTIQAAVLGLTVLGVAGATSLSLIRYEVVLVLFGPAFLPAADALAFLCWFSVLYALLSLIGTSLSATDRQKQLATLTTAYAVIALPILWLGSGQGATGLALAVLGSAVVNMTYHWIAFQRSLPRPLPATFVAQLVLLGLAGVAVAWGVPTDWALAIRVPIGALVCGCCLAIAARSRVSLAKAHGPPG